jgi:chromosome segregation protein
MKFERLRLAGFKSFCDPTEFKIEPGLTGVVGPNGCGKSNLVEAMRWVMGESSYKNMRASGMDDVIFSGSGRRPSRNIAEVGLVLDNSDRRAPAAFNDHETIEVTRRIERESGSTYRVNGREARARDVQLLFADASTGARSPAMVRQGQIGEIIAAKPQARRLILEEAAGVSGLHSRRHEAELRLKGAEDNLLRVEDVLRQIDSQVESLRKQAGQARRYRAVAAEIRRHDALAKLIAWRAHVAAFAEAERKLEADLRDVAERTRAQAETARAQAIAAASLPGLRDAEARAGAAVHRIALARDTLAAEEKRAEARALELDRRGEQLERDAQREEAILTDASGVAERLDAEDSKLADHTEDSGDLQAEAEERRADAERKVVLAEAALAEAQAAASDLNAKRNAMGAVLAEDIRRWQRLEGELATVARDRDALPSAEADESAFLDATEALEALAETLADAESQTIEAEEAHAGAREFEARSRGPLAEAERLAQRLETEARTLEKLLGSASGGQWPPVVDAISVARGFEAALGAALGDDLDASTADGAPAHWSGAVDDAGDAPLPADVESLARRVDAPPALRRRLAQIGVVTRDQGLALMARLRPGQRLVSQEGDLWRWDGFVAAAEAPTPAARRLAEKNRLGDLLREAEAARQTAEAVKLESSRGQAALRDAANAEAAARQRAREARLAHHAARDRLVAAERRRAQTLTRLSALDEALSRATSARDEAVERRNAAGAAMQELPGAEEATRRLETARAEAAEARGAFAEARAFAQNLTREHEARLARRRAIAEERRSWTGRREKAEARLGEIAERRAATETERETLADAPDQFQMQRRSLLSQMGDAETALRAASDERAAAETALAQADRSAREALDAMGAARESRAGAEERLEAARRQREHLLRTISTELEIEPEGLNALAGVKPGEAIPEAGAIERKLENYKQERERLGAVNLRADEELTEVETSRDKLTKERDDLTEAIKRLRHAIHNLNQEGRERLVAAFTVVNKHFGELFSTLFEGGSAELQLIESDDPLEAGLELLARPPGKRPATLTLLSGGEQALTAMALIFAVFLTNPSPICVLDEVDAPLDDYNVERFCDLLDEMRKRSDTRFVTITHNPVTMARMDRLFGVTMAERGVSQIVSVDLATAETFLEAS